MWHSVVLSPIHNLIIFANVLTPQPTEQFCLYCSNTYGGHCICMYTFTFMHLADAFIQSDFIQAKIFCKYVCSLGIEPTTFCAANAMLYHWATGILYVCIYACVCVCVCMYIYMCVSMRYASRSIANDMIHMKQLAMWYNSPLLWCSAIQFRFNTMRFDAMEKIWSLLFLWFRQTANHKCYVSSDF